MNPLESLELRLNALLALKELIDKEVAGLEEARKILKPFYEIPEVSSIPTIEEFVQASEVGITDAVRAALRNNAPRKLTATQIRDVMVSSGFDLSKDKYTNPMSTIHEVLRRLIKAEQVTTWRQGADRVFQWTEKPVESVSGITAALTTVPDYLASIELATKTMQEEMGRIAQQWASIDIPNFDLTRSTTLGDLLKDVGRPADLAVTYPKKKSPLKSRYGSEGGEGNLPTPSDPGKEK